MRILSLHNTYSRAVCHDTVDTITLRHTLHVFFFFFVSADGLLHFFSVILTVPLVQHLLNFGMLNVAMLDSYQQQWHISLHDYSVISCTV